MVFKRFLIGTLCASFIAAGCGPLPDLSDLFGNFGGDNGDIHNGDDTDNTDDDGVDDDDNVGPPSPDDDFFNLSGALIRSSALQSAQLVPSEDFLVVAQNATTGELYYGEVDVNGEWLIEVPRDEYQGGFSVTILDGNAQPAGPVLFSTTEGGQGNTVFELEKSVDLGTIEVPDDPTQAGINIGDDGDFETSSIVSGIVTRLDINGVPVGVPGLGKGDDAQNTGSNDAHAFDRDEDGLIDAFDADNDGDGVVDEFEAGGDAGGLPTQGDIRANFFMNLKIGEQDANTYYNGTQADIDAALPDDTVITFEVDQLPGAGRNVLAVALYPKTAPSYIADATIAKSSGGGVTQAQWSSVGYVFEQASPTNWEAFVTPKGLIEAGDTFTVEVFFDDGTTQLFSRMINFVFKNIPELVNVGTPVSMNAFSGAQPIQFDGTTDLAMEFAPPIDELNNKLTGLDYRFEVFFYDGNGQQIQNIDGNATWPGPITGWRSDVRSFDVSKDDLVLSVDDTYTIVLPAEIFADQVTQNGGNVVNVASYKIDIASQSNGNNAAIMLQFEKL